MTKRGKDDIQWQSLKENVTKRDKEYCRLVKILSVQEAYLLIEKAGSQLKILDPAHYRARSERPDLKYVPENVVLLNRFSHGNLDDCKHPITGKNISRQERNDWWIRILKGNKEQFDYLSTNYYILTEV